MRRLIHFVVVVVACLYFIFIGSPLGNKTKKGLHSKNSLHTKSNGEARSGRFIGGSGAAASRVKRRSRFGSDFSQAP